MESASEHWRQWQESLTQAIRDDDFESARLAAEMAPEVVEGYVALGITPEDRAARMNEAMHFCEQARLQSVVAREFTRSQLRTCQSTSAYAGGIYAPPSRWSKSL
jgi:hypothetical protein